MEIMWFGKWIGKKNVAKILVQIISTEESILFLAEEEVDRHSKKCACMGNTEMGKSNNKIQNMP